MGTDDVFCSQEDQVNKAVVYAGCSTNEGCLEYAFLLTGIGVLTTPKGNRSYEGELRIPLVVSPGIKNGVCDGGDFLLLQAAKFIGSSMALTGFDDYELRALDGEDVLGKNCHRGLPPGKFRVLEETLRETFERGLVSLGKKKGEVVS